MILILDESSQIKLENNESNINYLDVPSTSKSLAFPMKEDNLSNIKSDEGQQNINKSIYFVSKTNITEKCDLFYNASPSIESDHSTGSFSENSVDFSPDDNVSNDVKDYNTTLGLYIYL